jgi:ketosteroid isomerase-like protein
MRIALRALVLVLLAPAVCSTQTVTARGLSPEDIVAIKATSERWVIAVRDRRWEDAAATFTTDAILRFGLAIYEGRAAIQKFHESMPPFDKTRVLHIDEIDGRGDMAFVSGHSTIVPAGGGTPVVVGRYIDIRLRQPDGTWLFYRDVVTPVPLPAPNQ